MLVVIALCLAARNVFGYYEPEVGRWLSRDPIEERDGATLYRAMGNSPISYVDMLGLQIQNLVIRDAASTFAATGSFTVSGLPQGEPRALEHILRTQLSDNSDWFRRHFSGWIAEMTRRVKTSVHERGCGVCEQQGWQGQSLSIPVNGQDQDLNAEVLPSNSRRLTPFLRSAGRAFQNSQTSGGPDDLPFDRLPSPPLTKANDPLERPRWSQEPNMDSAYGDAPMSEAMADNDLGRFWWRVQNPISIRCQRNCVVGWDAVLWATDWLGADFMHPQLVRRAAFSLTGSTRCGSSGSSATDR